jgi:hypothetical protein
MTTTTEDRRLYDRFPAQHLRVLARSMRAENSNWEAGSISSVDFNRYGICLETRCNFAVGDILSMIIRTDDSTIAEINGVICNRSNSEQGFRFGVRFEHSNDQSEPLVEGEINISEEILMIERQAASQIH